MGYYKVSIQPTSSVIGRITSVTLFGAFCYAISSLYGADVLVDSVLKGDSESFAVSNLFHNNELVTWGYGVDGADRRIDHCMINRETGESTKWSHSETWLDGDYHFYIYSNIFEFADIQRLTELVLKSGLGAKRSVGKGQFKLLGIDEVDYIGDKVENPNSYVVISDYIPNKGDSTIGIYTARVYRGATGGVEKAPIALINAGAKFAGKLSAKVVGRLEYDELTNTYTCGRALAVPILV